MILLLGETIEFFQSFTASYRSYGNGTIAVLKRKSSNSADDSRELLEPLRNEHNRLDVTQQRGH